MCIRDSTTSLPGDIVTKESTDIGCLDASGLDIDGNGRYLVLNTSNDEIRYHVWFNLLDGVNTQNDPVMTNPNGNHEVMFVQDEYTFMVISPGVPGQGTGGYVYLEKPGISPNGSIVYLTTAQTYTGTFGPIIWDQNAAFVLSSFTADIQTDIKAGNNLRVLPIGNNDIPEEGFLIFEFGTEVQEGPVRFLFKPTDNSLQLDPAYVFQYNHDVGSSVTMIRKQGPHQMSGLGTEYGGYITDPAVARKVLENLILDVKSVGIFVEFLIRFPNQLYATLDVYKSGTDLLWPVGEGEDN